MTCREVRSTTSTRGARSRKRCMRGSSQPLAKAASVVSVSTPSARLVRTRAVDSPSRSKPADSSGR